MSDEPGPGTSTWFKIYQGVGEHARPQVKLIKAKAGPGIFSKTTHRIPRVGHIIQVPHIFVWGPYFCCAFSAFRLPPSLYNSLLIHLHSFTCACIHIHCSHSSTDTNSTHLDSLNFKCHERIKHYSSRSVAGIHPFFSGPSFRVAPSLAGSGGSYAHILAAHPVSLGNSVWAALFLFEYFGKVWHEGWSISCGAPRA